MMPCYLLQDAARLPCWRDGHCHGAEVWAGLPEPVGGAPDCWDLDYCRWFGECRRWLRQSRYGVRHNAIGT